MNLRYLMVAAVAGTALSLPVAAQQDPFEKLDAIRPEVLFKGVLREDDVILLFSQLRTSMAAAVRGEEARPSEAVTRRAEEIQREIAVRGSILMGEMLSAFESAARQAVREALNDIPQGQSGSRERQRPGMSH